MKKQYLHLSAYPCDACAGPVIAGSTAVRENEISKETDIRQVGSHLPVVRPSPGQSHRAGACVSSAADCMGASRWSETPVNPTAVFVEALNRAELH